MATDKARLCAFDNLRKQFDVKGGGLHIVGISIGAEGEIEEKISNFQVKIKEAVEHKFLKLYLNKNARKFVLIAIWLI